MVYSYDMHSRIKLYVSIYFISDACTHELCDVIIRGDKNQCVVNAENEDYISNLFIIFMNDS